MEEKVAALRRMIRESYLALPEEEAEELARDVAGLLDNVEVLAALPVAGGEAPAALEPGALRPDEAAPSLPADLALANAPDHHDGFAAVPKIIAADEKEETP